MDLPIKHITPNEVTQEISKLNVKKSPGFDKLGGRVIKALPKKAILLLTLIYNAILRLSHYPEQWKCAEIILVLKPKKPENAITSYRPISLLCVFSKIFEKLFLKRLQPVLDNKSIIPEYQFGFRSKHGTPEQCHRIVTLIQGALEKKQYCSAVFLDIKQAFDRVWHPGLLFKLKMILPAPFYLLLKSYLTNRHFYVKINHEISDLCEIQAGIPQGSVLGPILYTIFTSDMPLSNNTTVATYADDTALITKNNCPTVASKFIQDHLNAITNWLCTWNICVNPDKSSHITFTLRKEDCPAIFLQGVQIPHSNCVKYLGMHLDRRLT